MKKIFITLILIALSYLSFGQIINQGNSTNQVSEKLNISINNTPINSLYSSMYSFPNKWFNYALTIDNSNGGLGQLSWSYLFPDTQITIINNSIHGMPNVHSAAVVLDPTSAWFQSSTQLNITHSQNYMFDSIGILCSYNRNIGDANIVDTLIVEFLSGNNVNLPIYYFTGMSANYFSDTIRYIALQHNNGLSTQIGQIVKVALTNTIANDTTINGLNYIKVGLTSAMNVNHGEKIAITYQFKPGYSYSQTDTLSSKNYFLLLSIEEQGDSTFPTYSPGDYNSSQIITTESKFDTSSLWYGYYKPEWVFNQSYKFENHIVDFRLYTHFDTTSISLPSINNLNVSQNVPNPFNNVTTIKYGLVKSASVNVVIYNISGTKLMTITEGLKTAGSHQIQIDASNLPAGVYYYSFTADGSSITKKMIVY